MSNTVIILDTIPDKKIKSIGNRCLISIKKQSNVLDYHIDVAKKLFKNPQIIVVCGFESKKVKKYLNSNRKYNNIAYIEYDIDEFSNFGQALGIGLQSASDKNNCLVWNTNHILHKHAIDIIRHNIELKQPFIAYNKKKGEIGLLIDESNITTNCYYDLPNTLYDIVYLTKYDEYRSVKFDMSKLYLFEIINHYISSGIQFNSAYINSKNITIINNMSNIKKVQKHLCSI